MVYLFVDEGRTLTKDERPTTKLNGTEFSSFVFRLSSTA